MVAVIGAGCSNAPAEKSSSTTGPNKTVTNRDKAMQFAACMRDNGVSEFPDPDASGEMTIDGILNGSSLDPDAPGWKKAIAACKDLQPAGFMGHKRNAEEQKPALKFAQCMRDHGVKDFPDPTPDGPLVDTNRIPSSAGNMPAINAAMKTCGDLVADALEGR
jgi:hypothetical protein